MRNIRTELKVIGAQGIPAYELPLDGVRELIANAVCHRSYLGNNRVQVAIYDDRLEVTSPGLLVKGLSFDDLRNGCSQPRNPALADALAYMRSIEHWGLGLQKLFVACKESGLRPPEFSYVGPNLRVVLYRPEIFSAGQINRLEPTDRIVEHDRVTIRNNDGIESGMDKRVGGIESGIDKGDDGMEKEMALIVNEIRKDPAVSIEKISTKLGIPLWTVARRIKSLRDASRIRRVGPDRGGHWEVLK